MNKYIANLEVTDEVGNVGLSNEVVFTTGLRLDSKAPNDKSILIGGRNLRLGRKTKYTISLPSIQFLPNSDQPAQGSYEILTTKVFPVLNKLKGFTLRIEGHIHNTKKESDPQGINVNGIKFSYLRAKKIMDIFLKEGTNPEDITAVGLGATKPLAKDGTPSEVAKNRRVEIVLIKKQNEEDDYEQ